MKYKIQSFTDEEIKSTLHDLVDSEKQHDHEFNFACCQHLNELYKNLPTKLRNQAS